ncbi:MAG TPA: 5-formyltetrahydrofolate cyclo-ligase [Thermodesulfobacteriota bacterium]|nr:5-formyltetrahydrofolate cyclo-ligase [Thermodesulfobacteriota bacterium]
MPRRERRVEGGGGEKGAIRERVWGALSDAGAARFPGARGRIPNFAGADEAARRLAALPVWQRARTLKVNPDAPQRPVRQLALEQGKTLFMAVPRLATERPFVALEPARLAAAGVSPAAASTIEGAMRYGRPVAPAEMPPIELVVCGSVAVARDGARVGKGGGYSDLEYALLRELSRLPPDTPVVTTVHPLQILDPADRPIPMTRHDIPVDWIVTPAEATETRTRYARPAGIYWDDLPAEKRAAIPLLAALSRRR